jgi:hypothetical protein
VIFHDRSFKAIVLSDLKHAQRLMFDSFQKFLGEQLVCLGANAAGRVAQDRLAMAGRFAQTYIARDDGLEDFFWEISPDFVNDLLAQIRARVIHGEDNAGYDQSLIEHLTHPLNAL